MTVSADTRNWPPAKRAARKLMLMLVLAGAAHPQAQAQPQALASNLTTLSLEQLLEVTIVGASKYEQKQSEVAAAASIITRHEIKAFGWRTLGEALASLPGVHTTYDRQYLYLGTRGFGLPGDLNTRVLTRASRRLGLWRNARRPVGLSIWPCWTCTCRRWTACSWLTKSGAGRHWPAPG